MVSTLPSVRCGSNDGVGVHERITKSQVVNLRTWMLQVSLLITLNPSDPFFEADQLCFEFVGLRCDEVGLWGMIVARRPLGCLGVARLVVVVVLFGDSYEHLEHAWPHLVGTAIHQLVHNIEVDCACPCLRQPPAPLLSTPRVLIGVELAALRASQIR